MTTFWDSSSLWHELNVVTDHACNLIDIDELISSLKQFDLSEEHDNITRLEI